MIFDRINGTWSDWYAAAESAIKAVERLNELEMSSQRLHSTAGIVPVGQRSPVFCVGFGKQNYMCESSDRVATYATVVLRRYGHASERNS